MARLIGAPESWLDIWAFPTAGWLACGLGAGSNLIDCAATWPALIRSLKRRRAGFSLRSINRNKHVKRCIWSSGISFYGILFDADASQETEPRPTGYSVTAYLENS